MKETHNRIISLLALLFIVSACSFFGGNQNTPEGYVRHCVRLLDKQALYADRPEWKEVKDSILAEAKTLTTMDQAHEAVSRAAKVAGGKYRYKKRTAVSSPSCTRSRDRTGTGFTPLVFETSASTNSAIRASIVRLSQRTAKICKKTYQLKLMVFFRSG